MYVNAVILSRSTSLYAKLLLLNQVYASQRPACAWLPEITVWMYVCVCVCTALRLLIILR